MKLIRSGARDGSHDAARHTTILGAVVAGLYAELFQCVWVRQGIAIVAQSGHVDTAIQVEAHHRNAAVEAAIDDDLRRRNANDKIWRVLTVALTIRLHARYRRQRRIRVTSRERKVIHLLGGNSSAYVRSGR